MPNHIHGVVMIKPMAMGKIQATRTGQCPVRTTVVNGRYGLLSKIINSYKGVVSKEIRNKIGLKHFGWQRSFHDHVIRDKKELERIREYIKNNPAGWDRDRNNLRY